MNLEIIFLAVSFFSAQSNNHNGCSVAVTKT